MREETTPVPESGFGAVDWQANPLRVGIGSFSELTHARIDYSNMLRRCRDFGDPRQPAGTSPIPLGLYQSDGFSRLLTYQAAILATRTDANVLTVTIHDTEFARAPLNVIVPGGVLAGLPRVFMAETFEHVYLATGLALYKLAIAPQHAFAAEEVTSELSEEEDRGDTLAFRGVVDHDGHLVGWGFGDQSEADTNQIGHLGPNRPEVVRWSNIGNPDAWRCEDFNIVGARGKRVQSCVRAFGRLIVLKEEGAFILYGNLEQNETRAEALQVDDSIPSDCVAPAAAVVYDDALYWLSRRGPLRWRGGQRAAYLGRGIKGQWEAADLSQSMVFPVPEFDSVGFGFVSAVNPGDVLSARGTPKRLDVYLWETDRERWVGHFRYPFSGNAVVEPLFMADGEFRTALVRNAPPSDIADVRPSVLERRVLDTTTVSNTVAVAVTGRHTIPKRTGGIPKGVLVAGDWPAAAPVGGEASVRVGVEDGPMETVAIRDVPPAAPVAGQHFYATGRNAAWPKGIWVYDYAEEWQPDPEISPDLLGVRLDLGDSFQRHLAIRLELTRVSPEFSVEVASAVFIF